VKPAFVPITITLETEEEAKILYQKLNWDNEAWMKILRSEGLDVSVENQMFDKLGEAYKP
jgi:hypothetical protein